MTKATLEDVLNCIENMDKLLYISLLDDWIVVVPLRVNKTVFGLTVTVKLISWDKCYNHVMEDIDNNETFTCSMDYLYLLPTNDLRR